MEKIDIITWNHAKFIALKRSITIYENAIAKLESRIKKEESSMGVVVNLVKPNEGKSMRLDCEVPKINITTSTTNSTNTTNDIAD